MKRVCKKCGVEKEIEEFVKNKACPFERERTCKECRNKRERARDNISEKHKEYYKLNKDHIKISNKKRYELNKESISLSRRTKEYRAKAKIWKRKEYIKNKERIDNRNKVYALENKDKISKHAQEYWENNKVMLHAKQKLQNQKNRDELRDTYVKDQIRRVFSIPTKTIYEYPDLIENYRQQIKVKRLLKTKKDESNETS